MSEAPRLLCAALLLLAGSGLARAADPGADVLGKTLAGESCKWADAAGIRGTRTILCGADNRAAGTLRAVPLTETLPEDTAARMAAIVAAVKSAPGGLGATDPMTCDAGHALAQDGSSLVVFCTLESNGWPRIALETVTGKTIQEADGLPAMLPVLQAAIASASGHAFTAQETEAAIRVVDAKFPADLARAGGADVAGYKALVELGRLDGATLDFADAEAAYRRALEIETRLFGDQAVAVGETLMELALQVSNQERFDEAAALFRRAEPIINAAPDEAARARLASYWALDAANQRHFADALKFAQEATQMRRAELAAASPAGAEAGTGHHASRGELAHSLRIEADMALRVGDLPTAQAAATEVLEIINDDPGLPLWWRPEAVETMAEIDDQLEHVVPAERQFRAAVVMERELFGDTAPTALAQLRLGRFYAEQQVYAAAIKTYESALDILGRDPVARASIVPDQIVPFLAAAAALAERDPKERTALDAEAFRASQLVSSGVADRTVARAAARLATDNAALSALLRQQQDAQRQRDSLRIALAAEMAKPDDQRNGAHERKLAADLSAASKSADAVTHQLAATFPDFSRFADPGPAALDDLQHQLGPSEAFVSFVVGTKRSFALAVRSDSLTIAPLAVTQASLATDIGELRRAFVPQLGVAPEFDVTASWEVYRRLLDPLDAALHGVDQLVVVPTDALASLPLALLVTAQPDAKALHSYRDTAWLVRRMAISEVPSPRAFLSLRVAARRHAPAPKALLAVADPSYAGPSAQADGSASKALATLASSCREDGPMPADLLRALPPLHETADEVRTVARVLGGSDTLLLGTDATEANLRAQPLDQYRVLYFATHGLLPGELHCQAEPGLVLSPPATPATSTDNDGLLEASEIAGLKLSADLVVLSACNTAASGGQFGGEALAGLADAFFNAGARTVLASNWEVPSAATVKLMSGLFATLSRTPGTGLAQSLRQSQLALIDDQQTSHPFNWAAFTVIGDGAAAAQTAASEPARGGT